MAFVNFIFFILDFISFSKWLGKGDVQQGSCVSRGAIYADYPANSIIP